MVFKCTHAFFSWGEISLFSTAGSGILSNHQLYSYQTYLYHSKDQMKSEVNIFAYQSSFKELSLKKFFLLLNPLVEYTTSFPCSYSVLQLSFTHLIFNLSTEKFTLYPNLHLFFVVLVVEFLHHHAPVLPFLELPIPWKAIDFFIISP